MRKLILIVISAFALFATPAFAKGAGNAAWIVSQLSGDARLVHPGLRPASLRAQARLEPGDRIVTGLTGRATLTRGADYIIIAPRSDLQVPATPEPNGFTRVIQNLGTMLFKVKHTGVPHFAVDTPMLAAVVKGTTFTIIVDKNRSAVQVIQGVVQVSATDGGMSKLVEGGKTVFIDRLSPKLLIDADEHSPATTTSSSSGVRVNGSQAPSVAAIANLTEGLVHPGTPAPVVAGTTPVDTGITPVIQPAAGISDASVPAVTNTVEDVVRTTSGTVTDTVGTVVPGVTDTVADVVVGVTGTLTDVVGGVTDVAGTTVPGVTDTVTDVVGGVTDRVSDVVGGVTDVVDTTVPGVTDTVTDVMGGVTDVVDTVVPGVTDTVTDVVGGVADVVDTTVPGVTDTVTDVVDTVVDVVDTTVTGVTDTVTDTVTDLVGGLLDGPDGPDDSGSGSTGSGSGSGSSGSGSDGGLLGGILGGLLPH